MRNYIYFIIIKTVIAKQLLYLLPYSPRRRDPCLFGQLFAEIYLRNINRLRINADRRYDAFYRIDKT